MRKWNPASAPRKEQKKEYHKPKVASVTVVSSASAVPTKEKSSVPPPPSAPQPAPKLSPVQTLILQDASNRSLVEKLLTSGKHIRVKTVELSEEKMQPVVTEHLGVIQSLELSKERFKDSKLVVRTNGQTQAWAFTDLVEMAVEGAEGPGEEKPVEESGKEEKKEEKKDEKKDEKKSENAPEGNDKDKSKEEEEKKAEVIKVSFALRRRVEIRGTAQGDHSPGY